MRWTWTWWYVVLAVDLTLTAAVWLPRRGSSYADRAIVRLLTWRARKQQPLDPFFAAAVEAMLDLPRRDRNRVIEVIKKTRDHGSWSTGLRTPEQNESIAMFSARLREHGVDPLRYVDGEDDEDSA